MISLLDFNLFLKEKEILINKTEWLNDAIMNAAMQYLRKNFAEIGGLSDVLMVQVLRIRCKNKEFLQIISHSKCH